MKLYLDVTVQPYLKTYLAYYYPVNPFTLTEKNRFGSYLIKYLQFKTKPERPGTTEPKTGYRTASIEIEIPEHYWWNYGTVLNAKVHHRFNNFLLDDFHDRLMDYVAPNIMYKGDLNILLINFRDKYLIDEDELPLKTLQKMYQRETHRLQIRQAASNYF